MSISKYNQAYEFYKKIGDKKSAKMPINIKEDQYGENTVKLAILLNKCGYLQNCKKPVDTF